MSILRRINECPSCIRLIITFWSSWMNVSINQAEHTSPRGVTYREEHEPVARAINNTANALMAGAIVVACYHRTWPFVAAVSTNRTRKIHRHVARRRKTGLRNWMHILGKLMLLNCYVRPSLCYVHIVHLGVLDELELPYKNK